MFECINCGSHHQQDNDPELCCFACFVAWFGDAEDSEYARAWLQSAPLGVPAIQQPLSPTQQAARDKQGFLNNTSEDNIPF